MHILKIISAIFFFTKQKGILTINAWVAQIARIGGGGPNYVIYDVSWPTINVNAYFWDKYKLEYFFPASPKTAKTMFFGNFQNSFSHQQNKFSI